MAQGRGVTGLAGGLDALPTHLQSCCPLPTTPLLTILPTIPLLSYLPPHYKALTDLQLISFNGCTLLDDQAIGFLMPMARLHSLQLNDTLCADVALLMVCVFPKLVRRHYSLRNTHCTLHTARYALRTMHCTLHCTAHYTPHYTLHTTHYTLHTTHSSLPTTHYSLLTTHYLLLTYNSLLATHHSLLSI